MSGLADGWPSDEVGNLSIVAYQGLLQGIESRSGIDQREERKAGPVKMMVEIWYCVVKS